MVDTAEQVFSLADYGGRQLQSVLDRGDYTDITVLLSVKGEDGKSKIDSLKCHKLVLAAWSPVFKELMEKAVQEGHPNWVRLVDFEPDALKSMILTFYTGKLTLSADNVWPARTVAKQLGVQPVVRQCDLYLERNASTDTCVKWLGQAKKYGADEFHERCLMLTGRSFNAIKGTEEFLELDSTLLFQLLESHQLQAISEYSILMAALKWIDHDPDQRKELFPDILSRIRFNLMNEEDRNKVMNGDHSFRNYSEGLRETLTAKTVRGGLDIPRGGVMKRGVILDMPIDDIRHAGWKLVYGQPYKAHTSVRDLENIQGDFILVAASRKGERKIALCAMGRREKVIARTGCSEVTFENGVYWYFCPDRAFGFAPTPNIDLSVADTVDEEGEKRLSWHLHARANSSGDAGGFRAGMLKNMNDSVQWVKLVFSLSL